MYCPVCAKYCCWYVTLAKGQQSPGCVHEHSCGAGGGGGDGVCRRLLLVIDAAGISPYCCCCKKVDGNFSVCNQSAGCLSGSFVCDTTTVPGVVGRFVCDALLVTVPGLIGGFAG
jgi:hypothetical protein